MNDKDAQIFDVGLSHAQRELLAILAEECGEVVQAVGKILRHGYDSRWPSDGPSNRERLRSEIGDIACIVGILSAAGEFSHSEIAAAAAAKTEKIKQYLHFNTW